MKKSEKQVRSRWLRKLMHVHMLITGLSLSAYFSVAFFNPGFLSYDLREKYNALASDIVAITATVLDVPVKPVVSGTSQCAVNTLSIELNWADDVNTYTYDISRNGFPLVSGISVSGYSDTTVSLGTSYDYIVTAHGPMGPGFATSDTVSLLTLSVCGSGVVAPTSSITSFDGQNIGAYAGTPSVTNRRPLFTGTTNMSNAIIQVVVGPPSSFFAQFTANVNGYYSWQPPFDLALGTQVFTVTAIDPNDSLRQSSSSLQFETRNIDTGGGSSNAKHSNGSKKSPSPSFPIAPVVTPEVPIVPVAPIVIPEIQKPVDFSLSVKNSDNKIFQGETLSVSVLIKDIADEYQDTAVPVRLSVVDSKGNIISSGTKDEVLRKGVEVKRQMEIPMYVNPGAYSVQVEILLGGMNVSRLDTLTVAEVPLISLGGGAFITYAEVVHNMGWIVLGLFILLSLWLFMFMREYGMYLHALRHITEQHLMNAGLMTRRRGVIK